MWQGEQPNTGMPENFWESDFQLQNPFSKIEEDSKLNEESLMDDNEECGGDFQTGRWTEDEHERFLTALNIYGWDWSKVQNYVKTRSST